MLAENVQTYPVLYDRKVKEFKERYCSKYQRENGQKK